MNKQETLYAYFYRDWLNKGLKPIELLVLMEINSFVGNGKKCTASNEYFAELFNVCKSTIDAALNKLEKRGFIKRETKYVSDRGQSVNHREITLNDKVKHIRKNTQVKETIKQNRVNNDFSF